MDQPPSPWERPVKDDSAQHGWVMLLVVVVGLACGGLLAWRLAPGPSEPAAEGGTRAAAATPACSQATFDPRLAVLSERLGVVVGTAVECARTNLDNGDVEQRTTTGLATLHAASGRPAFSAGSEHWMITPAGVAYWQGESKDPPVNAQVLAADQQRPAANAVAVAGSPVPAAAGERARVANTDGSGVVLRSAPRDGERTPRGFLDGTPVTVLQRDGADWALVRGDNGQEGWIPTRYLAAP